MEKKRQNYASDLTDAQWAVVRALLKGLKPGTWPKRELLDAVFYITENGIKWRNLPQDFPPWKTVYSFFRRAKINGLWDDILMCLAEMARKANGRENMPSYGIIDSQSARTVYASHDRGMDGGKKG